MSHLFSIVLAMFPIVGYKINDILGSSKLLGTATVRIITPTYIWVHIFHQ